MAQRLHIQLEKKHSVIFIVILDMQAAVKGAVLKTILRRECVLSVHKHLKVLSTKF